ncbi:cupin, partial [Rhizobium ruizarguesonis]
ICMHLLTIPPGVRAKAHLHEAHETAIYMLSGEAHTWYGDRLEHHVIVHPHTTWSVSSIKPAVIIERKPRSRGENKTGRIDA